MGRVSSAHKVLLLHIARLYEFDLLEPTHPPYAVRHKMLIRALRLLGWEKPVTTPLQGNIHEAELSALGFVVDDPYNTWAAFLAINS